MDSLKQKIQIVESPMIKEVCLEERRKKMHELGGESHSLTNMGNS